MRNGRIEVGISERTLKGYSIILTSFYDLNQMIKQKQKQKTKTKTKQKKKESLYPKFQLIPIFCEISVNIALISY